MRHHALLLLLAASGCAGAADRPDPAPLEAPGALAELEASRTEVEAIRAAAADAAATLRAEASRWEEALRDLPTPLDRDRLQTSLEDHARRHRLELSRFVLGPAPAPRVELPAQVHPAAPFPVRKEHALVEPPIRFALTPLRPERIEAFLRTLPEVSPLVIVTGLQRGMDFVQVEATAATFRPFDPAPRFALELPAREAMRARAAPATPEEEAAFEQGWRALAAEVDAANAVLAALSEARLRHARLQAWDEARERAARNAAAIAVPPPARAGAPAPRTTVP